MRTKLDLIACYLADRSDGSAEPIRRELAEPSSEASLFLEALRERSRGMFAAPSGERSSPGTAPPFRLRTPPTDPNPPRASAPWVPLTGIAAALLLVASGVAWWEQGLRLRRFEAALARRDAEWTGRVAHLEAAQAERNRPRLPNVLAPKTERPAPPAVAQAPKDPKAELLLARLDEGLKRLEDRLGQPDGPPPRTTPEDLESIDRLRRELDELQRETGTREKALRKDLEEMRVTLRQVVFFVRQLANRPPVEVPVPYPYIVPVPSQGGLGNVGPGTGQGPAPGLDRLLPYLRQTPPQGGSSGTQQGGQGNHETNGSR